MAKVVAMNNFNFTLSDYKLSQPEWLWLIPLFIIVTIIFSLLKNKRMAKSSPASLTDLSSKQLLLHPLLNVLSIKTDTLKSSINSRLLHAFIFVLIILALTQPVRIGEKLPDPPQEHDIIFIVDTSVSMILRDYFLNDERIDRMSLLKGILDDFIRKLKGERMAIIVFGDKAYTLVPLTSDQLLLRRMLSRVQATMAGRFNAIGDAIALAVKQAQQATNKTNDKHKRKRVLVLLTDADQPTGIIDPNNAAELAKNANLPLYTIAIGATSIAAQEHRLGGLLYAPVDLDLLQQLSSRTGAKSYQAGNPNALEKAIHAINLHEKNTRTVKPQYFQEPLYHWLLISAFTIFTLAQLINIFKIVIFKQSKVLPEK